MSAVTWGPREGNGKIVDWNDARGFGFIEDADSGGRIFFHIRDFDAGAGRPLIGKEVVYEQGQGWNGRPAARHVRIVRGAAYNARTPMRVTVRIVGALMLITAIVCCIVAGRAPLWLALCYLAGGIASFVAHWLDKRAARQGNWRIAEATLHMIDLVCGIAGGLLAQGILRHKSSKRSFGHVSAAIFAIHMVVLLILTSGIVQLA